MCKFFPLKKYIPSFQFLNMYRARSRKLHMEELFWGCFFFLYVNAYYVHISYQGNRLKYIHPRNKGFAQPFCTGADNLKHSENKGKLPQPLFNTSHRGCWKNQITIKALLSENQQMIFECHSVGRWRCRGE